jgi:peptidyl-prolyl cis-trans isomerase C
MTILVNGVSITESDVLAEMQHHPAPAREQALAAAAEALIVRELLRQRAAQIGVLDHYDDDPEREEVALAALIERETASPVADDETLRRYYEANRAKFRTSVLFEASHILVAAMGEADRAEARTLALRLIQALQAAPEAFPELAAKHSACSSSGNGGSLGQLGEGEVAPELETFLRELEEGQLCPVPVETEFGFHVLRLDRRLPSQQMDFEAARLRVRDMLERLSRQRAVSQYISLLAGESEIEGYEFRRPDSPLVQ